MSEWAKAGDPCEETPDDPCAVVRCRAGTTCVAKKGKAECKPSCAAVMCPTGASCVIEGDQAVCEPNHSSDCNPACPPGHKCKKIDGKATCVLTDLCMVVRCSVGTKCVSGKCISSCTSMQCGFGTTCKMINGEAVCGKPCKKNKHCPRDKQCYKKICINPCSLRVCVPKNHRATFIKAYKKN